MIFPSGAASSCQARRRRTSISALNAEVKRILALPEALEKIKQLNFEVTDRTPEQAAAYVRAENEKYEKIIKEFGLKSG